MKTVTLLGASAALGVAAFAFLVPLGGRTLVEHGRHVFSTPEAEDAGERIKRGTGELVDRAVGGASEVAGGALDRLGGSAAPTAPVERPAEAAGEAAAPAPDPRPAVASPLDDHRPAEEAKLRKLLGSAPAGPR